MCLVWLLGYFTSMFMIRLVDCKRSSCIVVCSLHGVGVGLQVMS
jgi:hypothetical protein